MSELHDKIRSRLNELRVHLQADGGDLEIVDVTGKTARSVCAAPAACVRMPQ